MVDKFSLAKYLDYCYYEKFNNNSNRIWLHKSLYFLYAYWSLESRKVNHYIQSESDLKDKYMLVSEDLFDAKFLAWSYGPVEKDIYHQQKKSKEIRFKDSCEVLKWREKQPKFVWELLDPYIEALLCLNSFQLVDISRNEQVWSKNFERDDQSMNNTQIKEYYQNLIKG